jgi:hypothetical protein
MAYSKIRTNSKVFKEQVQEHILDNLSEDYHDSDHVADRLADVWNEFKSWKHGQRIANEQEAFGQFIDGLPSVINTEYTHHGIHNTMKEWFENCGAAYKYDEPHESEYNLYKNLVYMNLQDLSKKYGVHN